MTDKLIFEYGEKIISMLHEIADYLRESSKGDNGVPKTAAGRWWCKDCIHREMCKWYGSNGCQHIEERKDRLEYYMVHNDEGSGYGAYETLEDAIESLNTHNDFNNSDGSYNHIVKVIEIKDEVYRTGKRND